VYKIFKISYDPRAIKYFLGDYFLWRILYNMLRVPRHVTPSYADDQ